MLLPLREPAGPVVARASAVLGQEHVLRVVQLLILRVHDVVDDAGLEVEQHGAGNVVLIVGLGKLRNLLISILMMGQE